MTTSSGEIPQPGKRPFTLWRPRTAGERAATVLALVAVAAVLDALTDGEWRSVLVATAGLAALLAVLPRTARLVAPVAAYVGVWLVYNLLRARADVMPWADPSLGVVPAIEAALAGGHLPPALAQQAWYVPGALGWHDYALTAVYMSFFVVPHLAAVALFVWNRPSFWRYLAATAILFGLALVGFFALPTAPPWMVTEVSPDGMYAQIRRVSAIVMASLDLPLDLYNRGLRGSVVVSEVRIEPNPVAAMPSIHFASTALLIFPAFAVRVWLGWAAVVYAALMGVGLVYLGEHYLLDLLVGAALAAVGWVAAGRVLATRSDRSNRAGKNDAEY